MNNIHLTTTKDGLVIASLFSVKLYLNCKTLFDAYTLCRRGIKLSLEVDNPTLKLQSINPAFGPHCLMKTLRVMELSCPFNKGIEQTPLRYSAVNQHHLLKRSRIEEPSHIV